MSFPSSKGDGSLTPCPITSPLKATPAPCRNTTPPAPWSFCKKNVDANNENPENATLTLELNQVLDAAQAKKDTALIRALKEAGKDKNVQVRPLIGTCELSRYIHLGDVELVVYGPGLTKMAHKIDEYIEIDEYEDTIRIFKDTAVAFTESK